MDSVKDSARTARARRDDLSQRSLCWLAALTVLVGTFVALAPRLPTSILGGPLLGGLFAWSIAATAALYFLLRSSLSIGAGVCGRFDRALGRLGAAGIVLAVIAGSQLWLVRLAGERAALVWNADWRAALAHSQAIARFGDLERSLEYAGQPIHYHVGPAWLAGYFERVFGFGIEAILFGLLPLLSTTAVLGGIAMILLATGIRWRTSIASAGLATMVPAFQVTPLWLALRPEGLFDADTWSFGIGVMPNSYFGLAVGVSSLALLFPTQHHWWRLPLGAVGLATTVLLKPQYFAGLALLVGIAGFASLARGRIAALSLRQLEQSASLQRWMQQSLVVALIVLTVLPLIAMPANPALELAMGAAAYALILVLTLHYGVRPARTASASHALAAFVALAVAVPLFMTMPGHPAIYAGPAVAPASTGWSDSAYASTAMLLFVASSGLAAAASYRRPPAVPNGCNELAWLAALATAIVSISLQVVSFPIRPDLVERGVLLGMDQWGPTGGQGPLGEALVPLLLLVSACAIGSITTSTAIASVRSKSRFVACACLALLLFTAFLVRPMFRPDQGYEAAEDGGLRVLLDGIPIEGSILISSDIADPAQDYRRPANSPLLAAYAGHTMYVSELRWLNWVQPDAPTRLRELRIFFGSEWSQWHDSWLSRNGITHLLLSDRCQPKWWGQSDLGAVQIGRSDHWTAFRVDKLRPTVDALPPDDWIDMVPRFGKAECLLPAESPSPSRRS